MVCVCRRMKWVHLGSFWKFRGMECYFDSVPTLARRVGTGGCIVWVFTSNAGILRLVGFLCILLSNTQISGLFTDKALCLFARIPAFRPGKFQIHEDYNTEHIKDSFVYIHIQT